MALDWIFQGPNVGFMLAQEKGFYREAGLDVAITSGKGSGSTAQLVASKATQFGFADGYVVGNGVSKGMGIKSVGSIFRRNPAAAMVLADSGINTPKDLEGKSIAMTAGSAQFQQWPAFAKGAGIDTSKIQVVNIDPAGVGPALINGKVAAIGGFAQGYVPAIEIRGKKQVRIFWFADYGVTVVSNGIVVHQDLLKSDPELVRAFVTPTIKGFLVRAQESRRGSGDRQEISGDDRSGDQQTRAGTVVEDLGDAEHQGQAAGLGFRRRLGCYRQRAQAIWRRNNAARHERALHQ